MFRIILFLVTSLFALAVQAQQQIIIGGSGRSEYQPAVSLQKNSWFPGGSCKIVRTSGIPDMVTFNVTVPQHMHVSVIERCLQDLQKKSWKLETETFPASNLLREGRTDNMTCQIYRLISGPNLYQVRFSHLALTGKAAELADCMEAAQQAPDGCTTVPVEPVPGMRRDFQKFRVRV